MSAIRIQQTVVLSAKNYKIISKLLFDHNKKELPRTKKVKEIIVQKCKQKFLKIYNSQKKKITSRHRYGPMLQ